MTQQPAKSQEPTMEEILASIRRIIADDDASKSAPRPAEPPKMPTRSPAASRLSPAAPQTSAGRSETASAFNGTGVGAVEEQSADILDLTESMASLFPKNPSQHLRPHLRCPRNSARSMVTPT
jgi:cell pole-organizing protein PopZ